MFNKLLLFNFFFFNELLLFAQVVSQVALQIGFLKRLGDTVLLDLVSVCSVCSCHSRQTDDDQIRSLCGALAVLRQPHWIITSNGLEM